MAYYNYYPIVTDEQFAEVLATDKGIREAHFSIGFDFPGRRGKFFFNPIRAHRHGTGCDAGKFEITPEQQVKADELYAVKKSEALAKANTVGILTFVTMGADYATNIPDGLGNYRIRATFCDKKGHKWFVEVNPDRAGMDQKGFHGSWTDVTFEEDEQARFERETDAIIEKYGDSGRVPNLEWNRRKWPEQRHGYIGDFYASCMLCGKPVTYKPSEGRKFTGNDLRVWINKTFGCNYKEFYLDRHFLNCQDYVSRCV